MSKRFGRNQKRHMREQIAQSKAAADAALKLASASQKAELDLEYKLRQERFEHRDFIADLARLVGDAAVIVGHPELSEYQYRDYDRAVPHKPMEFEPFDESFGLLDTIRVETLRVLDFKPLRDHFAHQMHFRFELAGKTAGYAISEHALRTLPRRFIEERVAKEIARHLTGEIFGAAKGEKK